MIKKNYRKFERVAYVFLVIVFSLTASCSEEKSEKCADSEAYYERKVEDKGREYGPNAIEAAEALIEEASISESQGEYSCAEASLTRALSIYEKDQERNVKKISEVLNSLANLHVSAGDPKMAEPLKLRQLGICEAVYGKESVEYAGCLGELGNIYTRLKEYEKAEAYLKQALAILERSVDLSADSQFFSPGLMVMCLTLNGLGVLSANQDNFEQARSFFERALAIAEFSRDNQIVSALLVNIGELYLRQKKYSLAEPIYKRALGLMEQTLGPDSVYLLPFLEGLINVYRQSGEIERASKIELRSKLIKEKG